MSEEEKILVEKLSFLRLEIIKTSDAEQKYSIGKRIEETEKRLKEIRNEESNPLKHTPTQIKRDMKDNDLEELVFLLEHNNHKKLAKLLTNCYSQVVPIEQPMFLGGVKMMCRAHFKIFFHSIKDKAEISSIKDSDKIISQYLSEIHSHDKTGYSILKVVYERAKPNSHKNKKTCQNK